MTADRAYRMPVLDRQPAPRTSAPATGTHAQGAHLARAHLAGPPATVASGWRMRRLVEAAAEAGIVLAASALPVAWRAMDARLAVVLAAMFAGLTAATYALHAVTFDCLRLTADQERGRFRCTQRKE